MPRVLTATGLKRLNRKGIGLPGDNNRILDVARRLRGVIDAPVIGGIAVYLHGYARTTTDLGFYVTDRGATAAALEASGARRDKVRREHVLDDVIIHTVSTDQAAHQAAKTSIIQGIRVVSLRDLIVLKLRSGLKTRGRLKDLADVQELIRAVPLDKRFAGGLPADLRATFKSYVDAVRRPADE